MEANNQTNTKRIRPKILSGNTVGILTGCGVLYVTVNADDSGLFEVFVSLKNPGSCSHSLVEGLCRMISLSLASGVRVTAIVKQLEGIRCTNPVWDGGCLIQSCSDAIGQVLKNYITI